jgi:hypothetical protein
MRSSGALVLILGGLLLSGTASATGYIACSFFTGGLFMVNDQAGSACAVQDKLFQFTMASNNVYIGNELDSPAGMLFYGATQTDSNGVGDPTFPILTGPVDIEYMVSVIDPFLGSPNPQVISASTVASLVNANSSGSLGGTVKFCVGGTGFDGNFAGSDDGCAVNGGSLSSTILFAGNVFNFNPTTTSVAVWDHITLDSGATFGTIGQTFTQSLPSATPEPISLVLIGSGIVGLGLIGRKRFPKNRD